MSAEMSN